MKARLMLVSVTMMLVGTLALSQAFSALNPAALIPSQGSIRYTHGPSLPLHVEGRFIKNSEGSIVYLRGIHKAAFLDPPHTGQFTREDATTYSQGTTEFNVDNIAYNLDEMANMGMNVLRLFLPACITWINDDYGVRDRIGTVIAMANDRGIYVILSGYTVGASAGQTPIPWDPYTKSNERGIFTTSQDYIDFMLELTAYYSDHTNVMYDFWNEPSNVAVHQEYFDVCQSLLNQLRQRGDEHLVFYEFGYTGYQSQEAIVNQGQTLNYAPNPNITNVVYSVHVYRYIYGPGYQTYFNQVHLYEDVRDLLLNGFYMQAIKDMGLPQGIFEFAACNRVPSGDWQNEVEANTNILTVCNEEGFSYTPLHWQDASQQFGIFHVCSSSNPWLPALNDWGQAIADSLASQ